MAIPLRTSLLLLTAVLSSTSSLAQQPAPPAQQSRISLDVVVTPHAGAPVAGLREQDFTVLDNNVPRPIASFTALPASQALGPVEIILVIDAVNATFHDLAHERQEVDKFLKSNGGHLTHPVSLALFTDNATEIQAAPSTDGNQISASLDQQDIGLREIRRSSAFGREDRFNLSMTALESLVRKESVRPGRKLIFWISPGWPMLPSENVALDYKQEEQIYSEIISLSTALRSNDITLYSIDPLGADQSIGWENYYEAFLNGVKKPSQVQIGNLALQVIAVQSGGLAVSATNDTTSSLQKCMDDASAYYRISYQPPPTDHPSEFHRIQVKVAQPNLIARTRTGYYSEP